ncbi:MAG: translation elongation factor 4 [bacterium]|nr:translation elongation factor 4 [bacterium]
MNQSNIRNFCIIAHIDHGKSTLADRFLELTGTVEKRLMHEQYLDTMELEQERGITIKLQPVRMMYKIRNPKSEIRNKSQNPNSKSANGLEIKNSDLEIANSEYILNLIDTPGHVDFTYEVSRALAACEGAILLIDATQGIQAQTLANLHLAQAQKLKIIPVLNKLDLPNAEPARVKEEIVKLLGFKEEEILGISAKTGEGVESVLAAVIKKVPAPTGVAEAPARALVFDSNYDKHRGVVAYVRVVDGKLSQGEKIILMGVNEQTHILENGFFRPNLQKAASLSAGEVGYVVTDFKEVAKAKVGDTITNKSEAEVLKIGLRPLHGYKEVKPMVFASFFPSSAGDYPKLRDAISKLKLSDGALSFEPETIPSIGTGFRCGFLGLLHLDIVQERLFREYGLDLVVTAPTVAYKIMLRDGHEQVVRSAAEMPDPSKIESMREPWVSLEILTPVEYLGKVIDLVTQRRGLQRNIEFGSETRTLMTFEMPLANVIVDFYDKLKSVTSGYASMNYELLDYRPSDLVKLDILVSGEQIEAFSNIVFSFDAERAGRDLLSRLKNLIPRHQFSVALQAVIGGKVVAREDIRPFRKDVTAGLYGGDDTRKRKVLEKQKKGKKRMKQFGRVSIPQRAFIEIFKR